MMMNHRVAAASTLAAIAHPAMQPWFVASMLANRLGTSSPCSPSLSRFHQIGT
eukprot:CAMPEP_0184400962 /NCGR_PEP_ID=MMETSP0007-20130409/77061_1 /TAXON_ID=97485 /ORGANISM="Prymnesium parvum, Strain Texoma1" /LENGTH=52 /DNA_ID=CAMNT_0026756151 /DNA_START=1 /DNA_END=155 /DNA_ORIENTATION=-